MQNILAAFCFFAGAAAAWLWMRAAAARLKDRERECADLRAALEKKDARPRTCRRQSRPQGPPGRDPKIRAEKLDLLEDARQKLADAFKALSSDALARNNQAFLDLAPGTLTKERPADRSASGHRMVQPVRETLDRFETQRASSKPPAPAPTRL